MAVKYLNKEIKAKLLDVYILQDKRDKSIINVFLEARHAMQYLRALLDDAYNKEYMNYRIRQFQTGNFVADIYEVGEIIIYPEAKVEE